MPFSLGLGCELVLAPSQTTVAVPGDHPGSDILMENGSFLLLEDGTSSILME